LGGQGYSPHGRLGEREPPEQKKKEKKIFFSKFSLLAPYLSLAKIPQKSLVKLPTICANLSSYFPQFFFKKKKGERDASFFDKGQLK
jgi:hypothetical protein